MKIVKILGKIIDFFCRVISKLRKEYLASNFKRIGKNCYIGNYTKIYPQTISMGDYVSIGNGCVIQSVHGEIVIGNHVMFGPDVHIHGGNHKTNEIGRLLDNTTPKREDEDGTIVIEDDVWVGSCAIILKGVHIGTGSIIGAGSIVTKDIPPYSIYTNKVEPMIRKRFTEEEQQRHESMLRQRDN